MQDQKIWAKWQKQNYNFFITKPNLGQRRIFKMKTDSKSLYFKLRMEGKSDDEAQEICAEIEEEDNNDIKIF